MSILELNNVTLHLSRDSKPTLHQINYTIDPGDFVILLGSNGSGKSSLLKLLYRQYQPDIGNITLLGRDLNEYSNKEFRKQVAVLTQNCADSLFSSLTVYENFQLMRRESHQDRIFFQEYIKPYNPNLADKLDKSIEHLSGGEKQALALALCLLQPPTLLLLDEHTSALDPRTAEQIMQLTQRMVTQHRITCVLTTHNLDIALAYGDKVLMLSEGEINMRIDTENKQRLSREKLVSHYY